MKRHVEEGYVFRTENHEPIISGPSCVFYPNVYIGRNVVIGRNVTLGPGCVIGFEGFGYSKQEDETWAIKDHDYGVVIGDDVVIGANTCIDRGSWRDTVIGDGTKIDNLVHIAHNVQVGKNVLIVAHAGLGGSVTVGDDAWIGFGAHVNQRLNVGERGYIGTGSVVTRDVPVGMIVAGVPAKVLRERLETDV